MKILNAKGKSRKQIDVQVKRWFSANPNRRKIQVETDNGVITVVSPNGEKKNRVERIEENRKLFREVLAKELGLEKWSVKSAKEKFDQMSLSEKDEVLSKISKDFKF